MSVRTSNVYDVCCDACPEFFHTEADNALSARVMAGATAGWHHTSKRIDNLPLESRDRGGRGSRQFDWCPACFAKYAAATQTGAES